MVMLADLLPVADALGDFDGEMCAVRDAALTLALGARLVDDMAGAAAIGTGAGRLHVAQEGVLDADDAARALAARALDLFAAVGTAGAAALVAGGEAVVHDVLLDAACDFLEGETQADCHVAAVTALLTRAASAHAAKEGAEDVSHAAEDIAHVDGLVTPAKALRRIGRAKAVVHALLLRVGKHVVGLVELLEALFRIRRLVHVRMELTCLAPERLLDFALGCVTRDTENIVVLVRQ